MDEKEIINLKKWFLAERRPLPWRENPSPYAVWVSEVMLQQTQVSVVIPYFERWMECFPTVSALAEASLESVIKEWEGLGYYARVRNLHEGAKYVVQHYGGQLPLAPSQLKEIKGLGDYTVGAILNFAFHKKAAAVDGNVLRVLSRYFCIDDEISQPKTIKKIQEIVLEFLPEKDPWIVSEALIELGATICTRNPKCLKCPLKATCRAFNEGKESELPVKKVKIPSIPLFRTVAVVECEGQFLVRCGVKGKVMADLFEFPYVEWEHAEIDLEIQKKAIKKALKLEMNWQKSLCKVKHSFTCYRALLIPQLFSIDRLKKVEGFEWHSLDSLKQKPFSSGHRRIFTSLVSGVF